MTWALLLGRQHQQPYGTPWCCKPEKKSHDIVILSFCIVKGQAIYDHHTNLVSRLFSYAFWYQIFTMLREVSENNLIWIYQYSVLKKLFSICTCAFRTPIYIMLIIILSSLYENTVVFRISYYYWIIIFTTAWMDEINCWNCYKWDIITVLVFPAAKITSTYNIEIKMKMKWKVSNIYFL